MGGKRLLSQATTIRSAPCFLPQFSAFCPDKTASVSPNLFASPCIFFLVSPPDNPPAKVTMRRKRGRRILSPPNSSYVRNGLSSRGPGTTSCFSPEMTSVIGPEEERNCRSTLFLEWVFKVAGGDVVDVTFLSSGQDGFSIESAKYEVR